MRPLGGIRRPPLQAAGGAGQHEDGARRAHQRVPGRQRLFLRDAPLRSGQRRLRQKHARQGPVRLHQFRREGGRLRGDRPSGCGRRGRRLHHHRHRARPRRKRAQDDRAHQAQAAAGLRDRRQRGHARGRDRPGKLGGRCHQGGHRARQGLHHAAEDGLRHRRLAAFGAEVVRARGHQTHHRRRGHPPPWRHRQERALRRGHGDGGFALRRPRGVAGHHRRSGRQALQGVLRLGQRLQQGRVQACGRQAHPRAHQGPAGRHPARDARRPAKLHQLCGRSFPGRPAQGQLRDPRRRERR
jgi:hypothetical protein